MTKSRRPRKRVRDVQLASSVHRLDELGILTVTADHVVAQSRALDTDVATTALSNLSASFSGFSDAVGRGGATIRMLPIPEDPPSWHQAMQRQRRLIVERMGVSAEMMGVTALAPPIPDKPLQPGARMYRRRKLNIDD